MQIYIDGENCRKGITRLLVDGGVIENARIMRKFDLRSMLRDVLETEEVEIGYYASKIRLPNGYKPSSDVMKHVEEIREYTRAWVPYLELQDIKYIKAGYLKVKESKKCRNCGETQDILQEKGVDVRLAADMMEASFSGAETMVIMSSDSDLIPAIDKVKARGTKIIYVCFADSLNRAIDAVAHETVSISSEKIKKYYVS